MRKTIRYVAPGAAVHPVDGQQQRGHGVDHEAEVVDLHAPDHVAQPPEADDQHARHHQVAEDHPQQVERVGGDQRIEVDAPEDVGHRDDRDRGVQRRQQHRQRRVGQRHPLVAIGVGRAHCRPMYRLPVQVACRSRRLRLMQGTQTTTAELAHELRETVGPAHPPPARRARPALRAARRARAPRPRGAREHQRPRRRRSHAPAVDGADRPRPGGRRPRLPPPRPAGRAAVVRRADPRRGRDAARDPRPARGLADPDPRQRARRRGARAAAPRRWRCSTASPTPERVSPAASSSRGSARRTGRPRSSRRPPRSARRRRAPSSSGRVVGIGLLDGAVEEVAQVVLGAGGDVFDRDGRLGDLHGAPGAPGALEARDDGLRALRPLAVRLAGQLDGQLAPWTWAVAQSIDARGCSCFATRASICGAQTSTLRGQATSCSARRFHSALSSRQPSSVRVRFQ